MSSDSENQTPEIVSVENANTSASPTDLEARIAILEERCAELEKKSIQSGRGLFLSVIAIYAVFAALLILHWAGHVMRHPAL